jgi:hypothetical protein
MLDNNDFSSLNTNTSSLHYSCAGKTYLETITPHFEFFSARTFRNKYPGLFCAKNYQKGSADFKKIIEAVYTEVEQCCKSLKNHNTLIRKKNNAPHKPMDDSALLDSQFVAAIKLKSNVMNIHKQSHEERIINAHIGYLDRFRLYILTHPEDLLGRNKIALNEYLCHAIQKYVELLKTALKSPRTKEYLLPHYENILKRLISDAYKDFKTPVNKNP